MKKALGLPPRDSWPWFLRKTGFLAYLLRAVTALFVAGFVATLAGEAEQQGASPLWANPMLWYVEISFLALFYYSFQVLRIRLGPHDPKSISAVSVGAVSGIMTFLGVVSAFGANWLMLAWPPHYLTDFLFLTTDVSFGWIFLILTLRFHEACHFYDKWEERRALGKEIDVLPINEDPKWDLDRGGNKDRPL